MKQLIIFFVIVFSLLHNTFAEKFVNSTCVTPNRELAKCMSIHDCPVLINILKQRKSVGVQFVRDSLCGYEKTTVIVCCGTRGYLNTTITVDSTTTVANTTPSSAPTTISSTTSTTITSIPTTVPSTTKRTEPTTISSTTSTTIPSISTTISSTTQKTQSTTISSTISTTVPSVPITTSSTTQRTENTTNPSTSSTTLPSVSSNTSLIENVSNATTINNDTLSATTMVSTTTEKPPSLVASRRICGFQHTDDRFYSKNETAIDEFPWMALVRMDIFNRDVGFQCVGTLINRRYVLTSAHCIYDTKYYRVTSVRLGEYNIINPNIDCVENPDYPECAEPPVEIKVEKVNAHPKFNVFNSRSWSIYHDIALLRMEKVVRFTEFIRPICLPLPTDTKLKVGSELRTSGWGLNPDTGSSTIKRRGLTSINSQEFCSEFIAKDHNVPPGYVLPSHMYCAIDHGAKESCSKDVGVPAMVKVGLQWQQEGIFARHVAGNTTRTVCGEGSVAIYTKISDYIDWIHERVMP